MNAIFRSYRFLNIISLDIAAGAVACAALFAGIFSVRLRPQALAALGITVWIIYTIDHLFDAKKIKGPASTDRHRFHQDHSRVLWIIVAIAALVDFWCTLYIRRPVFNYGLGLAAIVACYLAVQRWLSPFKEAVAAILYCSGILLPALSLSPLPMNTTQALLVGIFLLTALINLVLFSLFDIEKDVQQTQLSLGVYYGRKISKIIVATLFCIQVILFGMVIYSGMYVAESVLLGLMNLVLLVLFFLPDIMKHQDRFRLLGDVIFLFPLPYLFLS